MSTRASLESKGYTLPAIDGDIYATENTTIVNPTINHQVNLGSISEATSVEIINNETAGSGNDLIVKLNAVGNDNIIIRAGVAKTLDKFPITAVFLTNSSGNDISYDLTAFGVSNT